MKDCFLACVPDVDWFQLLAELKKLGISNARVAHATGIDPAKIHRIKMGTEPEWSKAVAILTFYNISISQQNVSLSTCSWPFK